MSSDRPPEGEPRRTLRGLGPFPSSAALRDESREARATEPLLPRHRVRPAEPHRGAQLPPDAAPAPRSANLGAPVRLRGRWRAPSRAALVLARLSEHRSSLFGA